MEAKERERERDEYRRIINKKETRLVFGRVLDGSITRGTKDGPTRGKAADVAAVADIARRNQGHERL